MEMMDCWWGVDGERVHVRKLEEEKEE